MNERRIRVMVAMTHLTIKSLPPQKDACRRTASQGSHGGDIRPHLFGSGSGRVRSLSHALPHAEVCA